MRRLPVFETLHYDSKRKVFVLDKHTLKGLHAAISDCFFPAYTFERATLGPVEETKASTKQKSPARRRAPYKQRAQTRGLLLGSRVDRQLQQVTACMIDYPHLNLVDFLQKKNAPVLDSRLVVRHRIQTLRGTLNKHTREIIRVLALRDLRPIQSQVVVCHEELRVGTAVDLVCRHNKSGRIVIIEIKTGYDGYYFHHTVHNMLSPFTKLNDSPHNQHMVQLALTLAMYARVYGFKVQNLEAYVIRSHAGGVTVYPLATWARMAVPDICTELFQHERLQKALRHG